MAGLTNHGGWLSMETFLRLHESPERFRQALSFTEAETGFSQRLIEKDYYCSVILADFGPLFSSGLVFKGGTWLSKAFAEFYRLSEDLDFAISVATTARPRERRLARLPVKQHLARIEERLSWVRMPGSPLGHDGNRQYNAVLCYDSAVTGEQETVKIQVAVREPILEPTVSCAGRTLLRDPARRDAFEAHIPLSGLSLRETYAEKVRAALTREPPAIRDFYDIADAVGNGRLDVSDSRFLGLVQQKLAVPRNLPACASATRRESLAEQLETHLKPVLRHSDYAAFDFDRAFAVVENLSLLIQED